MFGVMCSTVLVSCYLCWTESSLFFHPLGSTNPRTDLLNELGPADVGVSLQEYNEKKKAFIYFFFLVCVYAYKLSYFSSFRVFLLSHTAHTVKIQVVTAES